MQCQETQGAINAICNAIVALQPQPAAAGLQASQFFASPAAAIDASNPIDY